MTETRIKKVKYVIEYRIDGGKWAKSNWNKGVMFSSDLTKMLSLLQDAHRNNHWQGSKEYRLIKETHSVTSEVVNE